MRSILLHVYEDRGLDTRIQAACDLARAFNGHLTCLHATPFEDYLATDPLIAPALPVEFSRKMRERREAVQARVEEELEREGVSWDWVHLDELISDALIRFSPLVDITVISRAVSDLYRDDERQIAGKLITSAASPVLAVPSELKRFDTSAPAVVAWNGSPEAANALRAGLPLLKLAASVHIVRIEERLRAYPPDASARYLSRHDVSAEIVQRSPKGSIADTLVEAGREFGAGLIVMGGYGHSRLREFLLGGVTRELLERSPLPLLLAH
ncbi:MAG: universal stress protein [Parasphingopyxis sp.]